MAVDHIEVPLVHRHVDRLADRTARMVQPGRCLRELHEIAEILDRAVAAAVVEIHHEGRAVSRSKHHRLAADFDRARRVARVLREDRRRGLQHLAQQARFEPDQRVVDICAGAPPMIQRHRVIAELDADFSEDRIGRRLDADEIFFRQDVVGRDVADDIGPAEPLRPVAALLPPRLPTAAAFAALAVARNVRSLLFHHRPLSTVFRLKPARELVTLENPDCLYKLSLCKTSDSSSPRRATSSSSRPRAGYRVSRPPAGNWR